MAKKANIKTENVSRVLYGATGIPKDLVSKDGKQTSIGNYDGVDTDNRFKTYQQFYTISPHVYISFNKFGLNLVKKIRFEGKKGLVKNFEKWADDIALINKLQTMARLVGRDGTYVSIITDDAPDTFDFEPLLMSQVTMLPAGITAGNTDLSKLIMPKITQIIVNESDLTNREIYRPENTFVYSFCPREKVQKDALGRDTFGIYGISLMDSVIDILTKYMDLVDGYTSYIKRYGVGRYFMDYTMLADLVKTGDLSIEDALVIMQDLADTHKQLKENEDIVGIGFGVKQLESGSANISVTDFKESLETDIQTGLLQSPVVMGRSAGSTFASAYVSEDDRMLMLEGMQLSLMAALNSKNGIIGKRLLAMGKQPGDVIIKFEELSRPKTTENGMYNAFLTNAISVGEFRNFMGLPKEMPEDMSENIKAGEITKEINEQPESVENKDKTLEDGAPDLYEKYPTD